MECAGIGYTLRRLEEDLRFGKTESSLKDVVQDSTGAEIAKCSKVEVQDKEVTLTIIPWEMTLA